MLFEQPHVLQEHRLCELDADHRWELATGDFFTEAPPGDIYLIKRILHDWDDEHCVHILRQCRQAVSDHGRVLVIDLLMMSSLTGQERTRADSTACSPGRASVWRA